jgi:hypothetical protein
MTWLSAADEAAQAVARHYAKVLDAAEGSGSSEVMLKAQNYGSYLKALLNDLGGTPQARGEFSKDQEEQDPVDDMLGDFAKRARRKKAAA